MPKNIVVYSDGTGQDGGVRPEQRVSNVYKMYRTSRVHPENAIDPHDQICFYDPGLGTDSDVSGMLNIVRQGRKILQSVEGRGITKNMADCYEFIINHYEPGDRVFLIGFSRGAYTVRCLANTIMLCGIPTKTPSGPLMRFRKSVRDIAKEAVETVYEHGAGHARKEYETERDEQARRFRQKYGSNFVGQSDDKDRSNAAAYFVGVFDTVAALGARGSRRIIIQIGLFIAFTVGFAILFGVLAVAPALIIKFALNYGFWWTELVLTAMLVSVANAWFWYRQRAQYTKTIRDFPNPGDPPRSHQAEWKSENFDRLLSKYVDTARSANAIDETRKDFDRVAWGSAANEGHLSQRWFAGNHSDIGGSYPETESRLSDISLNWMIGETLKLPYPLKLGPVTVNGQHVVGTGSSGTPLHLYPAANGVQHCEIAGMRDTLDAVTESWPRWLRWFIGTKNYEIKVRDVLPTAKLDETVLLRFDLPNVIDCAGSGLYRPKALRNHEKTVRYYSPTPTVEAIAEKPKTS